MQQCLVAKCHFCYSFFFVQTTLFNNNTSKMVQVVIVIIEQNWCSPPHGVLRPLSAFITLSLLWSIKLFTALPGCCPLHRTPFSDLVRKWTCSLVPRPKTPVIGLGARLVHTWNHARWLVVSAKYRVKVTLCHTCVTLRGQIKEATHTLRKQDPPCLRTMR